MFLFLKFSKQTNLANTYCKSKFKESLLFICRPRPTNTRMCCSLAQGAFMFAA